VTEKQKYNLVTALYVAVIILGELAWLWFLFHDDL
jgi:hypothetical protein